MMNLQYAESLTYGFRTVYVIFDCATMSPVNVDCITIVFFGSIEFHLQFFVSVSSDWVEDSSDQDVWKIHCRSTRASALLGCQWGLDKVSNRRKPKICFCLWWFHWPPALLWYVLINLDHLHPESRSTSSTRPVSISAASIPTFSKCDCENTAAIRRQCQKSWTIISMRNTLVWFRLVRMRMRRNVVVEIQKKLTTNFFLT